MKQHIGLGIFGGIAVVLFCVVVSAQPAPTTPVTASVTAPAAPAPAPCKEWVITKTQTKTRGGNGLVSTSTDEPIGAVLINSSLVGDEFWYVVTRRCTKS